MPYKQQLEHKQKKVEDLLRLAHKGLEECKAALDWLKEYVRGADISLVGMPTWSLFVGTAFISMCVQFAYFISVGTCMAGMLKNMQRSCSENENGDLLIRKASNSRMKAKCTVDA